ncbi:hypothetical protein [Acidithiobacillus ferrianus]|uniref:hypothetical protein n=1 Tax=Acidithiobacillus ferrianus TaxID=2678518 RepID=UPI0034E376D5
MINLKKPTKQTKMLLFGLTAFVLVPMVIAVASKSDGTSANARFEKRNKDAVQLSMQIDKATNPAWIRTACKQLKTDNVEDADYALKHRMSLIPPVGFKCGS